MSAILVTLLFSGAFAAAVWTLIASVRPQLHRYRALFSPAPAAGRPLVPNRVTVRWSGPVRQPARAALRAAA